MHFSASCGVLTIMGLWTDWSRSPAADYPNRLAGKVPPLALPRRGWTLLVLLLVCLGLRALDTLRWDFPWSDSLLYLRASEALEQRDYATAFQYLGLNLYPAILMVLGRVGLDPEVAGSWWSVAMASLTVLPLFGWVRRQFDDRVALVACLLYAVHPKLLAFSHLILRDPTYWFLFSLSLYLTWRAITEVRWWLFLASGIALTLTVYTRHEGWLLLIPVLLWALWRSPHVAGLRTRLVVGTATCLAVIPILVIVVNVTWLRDHPHWQTGRFGQLQSVLSRLLSSADGVFISRAAAAEPTLSTPPAPPDDPVSTRSQLSSGPAPDAALSEDLTTFVLTRKVLIRFLKALTYAYALLIAVGLWRWRHVFFRRDQQALLVHNLLLLSCVGVYYAEHKGIDIRYVLPIVLVCLPYAALGVLQVAEWIVAPARHPSARLPRRRAASVAGLLGAVTLIGIPDAVLTARPVMVQQAELGRWIFEHLGPNQTVVAPGSVISVLERYSKGRIIPFAGNTRGNCQTLMSPVCTCRPNVVILWEDIYNRDIWTVREEIALQCVRLGYERVPPSQLPPECQKVQVFVDRRAADKLAGIEAPAPDHRRF